MHPHPREVTAGPRRVRPNEGCARNPPPPKTQVRRHLWCHPPGFTRGTRASVGGLEIPRAAAVFHTGTLHPQAMRFRGCHGARVWGGGCWYFAETPTKNWGGGPQDPAAAAGGRGHPAPTHPAAPFLLGGKRLLLLRAPTHTERTV